MCFVGVTEGVSWGELATEPASLAPPDASGMAMKEPLASIGPFATRTFASACRHPALLMQAPHSWQPQGTGILCYNTA